MQLRAQTKTPLWPLYTSTPHPSRRVHKEGTAVSPISLCIEVVGGTAALLMRFFSMSAIYIWGRQLRTPHLAIEPVAFVQGKGEGHWP